MGNGPGGTGMFRGVSDAFSEPGDDPLRFQKGYRLGIEYIINNPVEWLITLPKKIFHLWVGDFWNLIERRSGIALLCSWGILLLAATIAIAVKPIRGYWLRFPALLFPLTIAYWTVFHMMFFGIGRFHTQMIPLVAIIAVHLIEPGWRWRMPTPSGLVRRWRNN